MTMYNKANKATLSELNKQHEIVKLLSTSLSKAHVKAEEVSRKLGLTLKVDTLVDGRYTHKEYVDAHLELMMFLLKEGDLYLSWSRCKELWETLVANPNCIQMDHDSIFTWFTKCLKDLEPDTQRDLFNQKLLTVPPAATTQNSFSCIKAYFESVNEIDSKLKITSDRRYVVADAELTGMKYFWDILITTPREDIADIAADFIIHMTTLKLIRKGRNMQRRFVSDLYHHLENHLTKVLHSLADAATYGEQAYLLKDSHLLLLVEKYVSLKDLPHGKSEGLQLILNIVKKSPLPQVLHNHSDLKSVYTTALQVCQYLQKNDNGQNGDCSVCVDLETELLCPVCLSIPRDTPVHSCPAGHIVCATCKGRMDNNKCPSCRQHLNNNTNSVVASMITKVRHQCKYAEFGCIEKDFLNALTAHERKCSERTVQCPRCRKIVVISEYLEHVIEDGCAVVVNTADENDQFKLLTLEYAMKKWKKLNAPTHLEDMIEDSLVSPLYRYDIHNTYFFFHVLNFKAHKLFVFYVMGVAVDDPDDVKKYKAEISIVNKESGSRTSAKTNIIPIEKVSSDVESLLASGSGHCWFVSEYALKSLFYYSKEVENNETTWKCLFDVECNIIKE